MREIKFRMWDQEEKEMIPGDALAFEEYAPLAHLLNQDGIMQFIGLHDKYGKEIYEGDKVKDPGGNIGKVQRSTKEARFEVFFGFGTIDGIMKWWANEQLEVVGNIYEGEIK